MRFKRPEQPIAAIRCPSCRHLFEVESALLPEEPILAIVVEEEPLPAVVIVEPTITVSAVPQRPQRMAQPGNKSTERAIEVVASDAVPVSTRPVLPHKQAVKAKNTVRQPVVKTNRARWIIAIAVGLVLCTVSGLVLTKFLMSRSQPSEVELLGIRYQESLEAVRQSMLAHQQKPDHRNVDEQVLGLRALLVDCVNTPVRPESQSQQLREDLIQLYDLQVETKRLTNQVASSFDRKSLVDQVPIMIELVNKQLNYGIREVSPSPEAFETFCRTAFVSFRNLDQSLGRVVTDVDEPKITEIAQCIDDLDQIIADYSKRTESRTELNFESKQILECGIAWRGWCLRQMQLAGHSNITRAITAELDSVAARFDQAVKAVAVDRPQIAALDRLNKRIGNSTLGAALSAESSPGNSSGNSKANSITASASENSTSTSPRPNTSKNSDSETENPFVTQNSSSLPVKSETLPIGGTIENSSAANNSFADSQTTSIQPPDARERAGGESKSGSSNSLSTNETPIFPPARYQGTNSLAIKVITSKSQTELRQIGITIASRISSVHDLQMQGNQATLSFSNFSGKVHDAIKYINFGKVEIADSQSRTLFVTDSQ